MCANVCLMFSCVCMYVNYRRISLAKYTNVASWGAITTADIWSTPFFFFYQSVFCTTHKLQLPFRIMYRYNTLKHSKYIRNIKELNLFICYILVQCIATVINQEVNLFFFFFSLLITSASSAIRELTRVQSFFFFLHYIILYKKQGKKVFFSFRSNK